MQEKVAVQVGSHTISFEAGHLARQADGAVTVQLGETVVLVAAVASQEPREGIDFFPLTVDYREKAAAAGRLPGGYFRREGRPTEKEVLTSRMIDRPLRPLFPKGWFNDVQIHAILLSADGENEPDVLAVNGASAALLISDIPWAGPVAAVRVGRIDGQLTVFPTHSEMEKSDLDLVYVGTQEHLMMIEGSAGEIKEEDFVEALRFAHISCQPIIAAQKLLAEKLGKPKRPIQPFEVPQEIIEEAKKLAADRILPTLLIPRKREREMAWKQLTEEIAQQLKEKFGEEQLTDLVLKQTFYKLQSEAIRGLLLNEGKRLDGRGLDDLRPVSCAVSVLPRVHGSALFTRGETQALAIATLGTIEEAQELDAYAGGESEKQFMLHYNFPHFAVGEVGRITGPGRREIGHGALAERCLERLLPLEEFPYAIRVTSDILESNGSSSMATVCAGSLALMDAGIPLKKPVAGVSIGLCTETDEQGHITRHVLITDIIGAEDAFGDMDCKIAGTEAGITGFQLDLKLPGLPISIMEEALQKAREARLQILEIMNKTLSAPRPELSPYAPRILTLRIKPEKIGVLIGPGGKNIKRIVDQSGCEINIEDDGTIHIYSRTPEGLELAKREIEAATAEVEVGKIYRGKVVNIKDFGAFVEIFPGQDGLVHISELANFRVKNVQDIVKVGDEIWVKCLGIDEKGRVRLSRRAAMEERDRLEQARQQAEGKALPEPTPASSSPTTTEGESSQTAQPASVEVLGSSSSSSSSQSTETAPSRSQPGKSHGKPSGGRQGRDHRHQKGKTRRHGGRASGKKK